MGGRACPPSRHGEFLKEEGERGIRVYVPKEARIE